MALGTFNSNGYFYSSYNATNLNKKSFAESILRLFPQGSAKLYALTGEAQRREAASVTHGYFTKHMAFTTLKINGAVASGATTTITVDSTGSIIPGMVFQIPSSRENIRVRSVTSSTVFEADRGFGRVTATDIDDDEDLKLIGSAYAEATDRPTARSMKTVWVPNYTILVKNAWAVSGTTAAELAEAGFDNVQESKLDCMALHGTEIEGHMLFSQPLAPTTDATTSKPIHSTQGIVDAIYQYASDNIQTAGATTNYNELVDLTEKWFTYGTAQDGMQGNAERTVFTDSLGMKVFHEIGRQYGQITMEQAETSFGMRYTYFKTYKGIMRLMEHPLLNESAPNAGIAIAVDLPTVGVAYLKGRDVKRESYDGSGDGSNSGVDAQGGSLLSEFATEFKSPQTCGIINGLTAGN